MIIKEKTSAQEFGDFVKLVVDIERKILAMGCELHIDCAEELVQDGSSRKDLWGANFYPPDKKIAFSSLINIRPQERNRGMEIQIPEVRAKVESVIRNLLE